MPYNVKLIPEGFSQATNRGVSLWFDQHKDPHYRDANGVAIMEQGRPYWSWVERPANGTAAAMPVGEVMPMGWHAPFRVPQAYITESIGRVQSNGTWLTGPMRSQHFRIDYAKMLKHDKDATSDYYQLAVNEAVRLGLKVPEPGSPLEPRLRMVVGPPPRSPKIAEACIAGDKWILGQQMPVWSEKDQRHIIPENKYLATLLRTMHQSFLTPEEYAEMERAQEEAQRAVLKPTDEMKRMQEMLYKALEEIEALKEKPAAKRGRSKKSPEPEPAEA